MKALEKIVQTATLVACGVVFLGGCASMRVGRDLDPTKCRLAYARGDYETLIGDMPERRFERLDSSCQDVVLRAAAQSDPATLLRLATWSGDTRRIVSAAVAAGSSPDGVSLPLATRRVLERLPDGRVLLAWWDEGDLPVPEGRTRVARDLVRARKKVARALRDPNMEASDLRAAVRSLALVTEEAIVSKAFTGDIPAVPSTPRTNTLRALAVKLALLPYLKTDPENALAFLGDAEG